MHTRIGISSITMCRSSNMLFRLLRLRYRPYGLPFRRWPTTTTLDSVEFWSGRLLMKHADAQYLKTLPNMPESETFLSFVFFHLSYNFLAISSLLDKFGLVFQNRSATSMATNMESSSKVPENEVNHVDMLNASFDSYGGVTVNVKEDMDENIFTTLLRTSISQWRQQGKKGVWLKLTIELVNLVKPAVKEGFWYHHAEPTYLMLVYWIPETSHTLPPNASHRVGVASFVVNDKGELLVVQEKSGVFKGTGVWKLPTGTVEEGEDISVAAIREVKEEAGIDTEFVEVLAFRQSHKSFFTKSDLMFVCMLKPKSSVIEKQDSEIEAAQWMPVEEYANQPFIKKHKSFDYIAKICMAKKDNKYAGFCALSTATATSAKKSYLYSSYQEE